MTSPDPAASQPQPVTPLPGTPLPGTPLPRPAGTTQAGIVAGVILIVIGGVFLAARVADLALGEETWPLWIIVPGLAMLVGSLAIPPRGGVGLAIPGAIVTMAGLVLWVQATYDLYETWAYAWALVAPTGVGLGMLIYGVARGDAGLAADGLRTSFVGLALFAGFALFFEGVVGLSGERVAGLNDALPFVVIGLGGLLVVLSVWRPGRARDAA